MGSGKAGSCSPSWSHGNLDHAVPLLLEELIGLGYPRQRKAMRDERSGVYPAVLDESEYLLAVATVHPSRLEGEVLAIHPRQRQHLGFIVESHDRHDGIGAGALPRQLEGILAPGHLQHPVGSSMVTVPQDEVKAFPGSGQRHLGITLLDKSPALFRPLADDDALGVFQHGAEQGTDTRGSRPDDEHGVFFRDLADAHRPESRGKDVTHEQSLLVGHAIGDAVQSLLGQWHTHVFRLSAVNAATQSPPAMRRGAVVHVTMPAEITFPAKGLHVHGHPVSLAEAPYLAAQLFHHAHHLVAHGDARHGPGHAAVLDVQVTGADTAQRHAYKGVCRFENRGFGLVDKLKPAFIYIGIRFHHRCKQMDFLQIATVFRLQR